MPPDPPKTPDRRPKPVDPRVAPKLDRYGSRGTSGKRARERVHQRNREVQQEERMKKKIQKTTTTTKGPNRHERRIGKHARHCMNKCIAEINNTLNESIAKQTSQQPKTYNWRDKPSQLLNLVKELEKGDTQKNENEEKVRLERILQNIFERLSVQV